MLEVLYWLLVVLWVVVVTYGAVCGIIAVHWHHKIFKPFQKTRKKRR